MSTQKYLFEMISYNKVNYWFFTAPDPIGPFGIRTALGLGLGLVRLGLELDKCISWITTMFGKC